MEGPGFQEIPLYTIWPSDQGQHKFLSLDWNFAVLK